jgi:hypothetical protein
MLKVWRNPRRWALSSCQRRLFGCTSQDSVPISTPHGEPRHDAHRGFFFPCKLVFKKHSRICPCSAGIASAPGTRASIAVGYHSPMYMPVSADEQPTFTQYCADLGPYGGVHPTGISRSQQIPREARCFECPLFVPQAWHVDCSKHPACPQFICVLPSLEEPSGRIRSFSERPSHCQTSWVLPQL